MKRIIYGAPPSNTPSGGVKVIYRHSEILRSIGVDSSIWHPGDDGFKCTWFENSANIINTEKLSPETDFLIIPEIWASSYVSTLKKMGFDVAIFVQNCYYTHFNLKVDNPNAILEAYREADLVLSISKDTTEYLRSILNVPSEKIVEQRYSVNKELFRPHEKSKLITYMPRKMEQHSSRIVTMLSHLIPNDWEIRALENMTEREIAKNLSESIIFLAFSEFEGLPVPPVEAVLSGNIVIGYHGQGGKEYWHEPNFVAVEQGDVQKFIQLTLKNIDDIRGNKINLELLNSVIGLISKYFDKEIELKMLENLIQKIEGIVV